MDAKNANEREKLLLLADGKMRFDPSTIQNNTPGALQWRRSVLEATFYATLPFLRDFFIPLVLFLKLVLPFHSIQLYRYGSSTATILSFIIDTNSLHKS